MKSKIPKEVLEFDPKEEELILKKAGVTDLIETMICKNCLYFEMQEGKPYCKERKESIDLKGHCGYFTENMSAGKELKEAYDLIIEILKDFIDTRDENYKILALWILGTWFHEHFTTYPYLFLNAMKGSGKTRLMKLIKELSKDGDMLASLSEAVMFRTTGTICIDEFESISSKEKSALRELLNTAYKKGGKVKRVRQKKTEDGVVMVVDEFDTFRPVCMANIAGMDEVVVDRCIVIILEKSNYTYITKMVEDFENHPTIKIYKNLISRVGDWCSVCSFIGGKGIYTEWNKYVKNIHLTTHTTTLHNTTPNYTTYNKLFDKIYKTDIDGRNLEITLPLLLLANDVGVLDDFIPIVKDLVQEKKEEDFMEARDVMFYAFVTEQMPETYIKVKQLTNMFRERVDMGTHEENWLNDRWVGKALRRLNLILKKRRLRDGIEVILDVKKAQEKMKIFK